MIVTVQQIVLSVTDRTGEKIIHVLSGAIVSPEIIKHEQRGLSGKFLKKGSGSSRKCNSTENFLEQKNDVVLPKP